MPLFECDMGQGSSGGPLIYRLSSTTGWVVGNVSSGDNKRQRVESPAIRGGPGRPQARLQAVIPAGLPTTADQSP
jgi:hypothetical protein